MKMPPFLLGAALLFWGWQTNLMPLALTLAVLLEGSRLMKSHWDLNRNDWGHIGDVCSILLLSILVIGFMRDKLILIYFTGKLLPLIFFPLIAAQKYSTNNKVDLQSLSLLTRKKKAPSKRHIFPETDLSFPYCLVLLVAAGIGNTTTGSYFIGITLLSGWAIFELRARHLPIGVWAMLLLLVSGIGFAGQAGLFHLQDYLLNHSPLLQNDSTNPFKSATSIGDIGRQKLYNRIIFRAKPEPPFATTLLLHEASYNLYKSPNWYAIQSPLNDVQRPPHSQKHQLTPPQLPFKTLEIISPMKKRTGTLRLPDGTFKLEGLPQGILQTNDLGAVVLRKSDKGLLCYRAHYSPDNAWESPPDERDLIIPEIEHLAIQQIVNKLKLSGMLPEQIATTLKYYFQSEFDYTLEHKGKGDRQTPLAYFLLDRQAGHCELFATATVMALRHCGIPARYAVGYVATEYSALEKCYIIRQRHAHAWTRVYINGSWRNLDTTSPNWLALEEDTQSPFYIFADIGSFIRFKLVQFRWSERNYMEKLAIGLMLLLIAMIVVRLKKQKGSRKKKKNIQKKKSTQLIRPGLDSDFFKLEQLLHRKGYPRNPGEPLSDWTKRLQLAAPTLLNYDLMNTIIHQHYRLRFDSKSLSPEEDKIIRRKIDLLITNIVNDDAVQR